MLLAELVATSAEVAATRSRKAKTALPTKSTVLTPTASGGTFVSHEMLLPQTTTVPSAFTAALPLPPAAMATTLLRPEGT